MTPVDPTRKTSPKPTRERLYGGMTADERRAERRRRLLDTALELFGTDGYPYTGIERICSHAGVTARHFYEEFGSREGLLTAVYDEIVSDILAGVAAAITAAPEDAIELTRAGLCAFVHGMVDDPRRARVSCLEVVGVSPNLEAHRRRVLRLYADLVAEQSKVFDLERDEDLPPRRQIASALALVGGTNELMIEWLTAGSTYDATVDELIDDLLVLFVGVGQGRSLVVAGEIDAVSVAVVNAAGTADTERPRPRRGAVAGTLGADATTVINTRTPPAHRRTV